MFITMIICIHTSYIIVVSNGTSASTSHTLFCALCLCVSVALHLIFVCNVVNGYAVDGMVRCVAYARILTACGVYLLVVWIVFAWFAWFACTQFLSNCERCVRVCDCVDETIEFYLHIICSALYVRVQTHIKRVMIRCVVQLVRLPLWSIY